MDVNTGSGGVQEGQHHQQLQPYFERLKCDNFRLGINFGLKQLNFSLIQILKQQLIKVGWAGVRSFYA